MPSDDVVEEIVKFIRLATSVNVEAQAMSWQLSECGKSDISPITMYRRCLEVTNAYADFASKFGEGEKLATRLREASEGGEPVDWPTSEGWWWFRSRSSYVGLLEIECGKVAHELYHESRSEWEKRNGPSQFIKLESNPFDSRPDTGVSDGVH